MTETVLVVDTDPSNCNDWKALLLDQGYEVIAVRDGEAAIILCLTIQPDLFLVSDVLPDANGLEICRRLKSDPRSCMTPVILFKPSDGLSYVSEALDAGVDDVWTYLPTPQEALNRVHSLLQAKMCNDLQAESKVFSIARSIEARNPFERGHGERVSNNAVRFGKSLSLSHSDLETLRVGGLVHDIGKIVISDLILSKPGPLDFEETEIVKRHASAGESICSTLKSFRHVLPLIRSHHERMDGSGYPDRLAGNQIPLTVRVLQIADICDALTSDRPYRKKMSLPNALVVLYEEAAKGWLQESLVSQFALMAVGFEGSMALANRQRFLFLHGMQCNG